MRFKRTRYLIALFAAMFVANSVAAGAHVSFSPLVGEVPTAAGGLAGFGGGNFMEPDTDPCLDHCIQAYTHQDQHFATAVSSVIAAPVRFAVYHSTRSAPRNTVIARSPMILGPPLTILFRNFRN